MSCTHACALSWHLQLSLASPAEDGMTIILERLCISPTEAIRQGKPYMQHSPLLLRSVEQENKQRSKQTVIPIVASLKPCVTSEQGKSTTVA
jgi:hypothetical protein